MMKRPSENDEDIAAKRTKATSYSLVPEDSDASAFDVARQRKARDICELGADEDGFVAFKVYMKWDDASSNKVRLQAASLENGDRVQFEVLFEGACLRYFDAIGLRFDIGDMVYLSLKGVAIKRKSPSKASIKTLPVQLEYSDGVRLKFVEKMKPLSMGMIVDTWKSQGRDGRAPRATTGDAPFKDDWFSTPAIVSQQPEEHVDDARKADTNGHQPGENSGHDIVIATGRVQAVDSGHSSRQDSPEERCPNSQSGSLGKDSLERPQKKLYRDVGPQHVKAKAQATVTRHNPSIGRTAGSSSISTASADSTRRISHSPNPGLADKGAKKREKKVARVARKAALNGVDTHSRPAEAVAPSDPLPESDSRQIVLAAPIVPTTERNTSPAMLPLAPPNASPAQAPAAAAASTAYQARAACIELQGATWCSLANLSPRVFECLIGVVFFAGGIATTATGESYRRISIVDTSIFHSGSSEAGITITYFAKRAKECLPDPQKGDVLVMRNILIESPHGGKLFGSCPSFKLWSWTIFHPETGTLRSGGTAQSSDAFPLELTSAENQYCISLADWWLELLKEDEQSAGDSGVIVHQISASDVARKSSVGRVHKLIKDASPHAPPAGYFDCTIEVLSGHQNDNGVYSLYVTDYTRNDSVSPVNASWCVPALSNLVFKIELWNEAAIKGPELKPHEYYEIKNVRIKESTGGYWEGSFSEVKKLRLLDENELDEEPSLFELLQRKKAWQDEAGANGTRKFPHKLLQDAEPDAHFDCTVELLHILVKSEEQALLFVTDYTARPDFSSISPTATWTRDVERERIFKVALSNAQAKAAQGLQAGDIISIRSMRMMSAKDARTGSVKYAGRLGGNERLVYKLDHRNTGNEHCIALLRRKEEWELARQKTEENNKKETKTQQISRKKPVDAAIKIKKPTIQRLPGTITLSEAAKVHPQAGPAKFLVLARVVDYYPDNIEDFVSLYCSQCGRDIPDKFRNCTECDTDTNGTPYYKFSLEVEDDTGSRLQLPMASSKRRGCGFLSDLQPADLREDEDALIKFKSKMRPLLGDLLDRHEEAVDTPFHNITLVKAPAPATLMFWDYTPLPRQEL